MDSNPGHPAARTTGYRGRPWLWAPWHGLIPFWARETCPGQWRHEQGWPCWEGRPDRLDWPGLKNSPAGPHSDRTAGMAEGLRERSSEACSRPFLQAQSVSPLPRRPPARRRSPAPHAGPRWAAHTHRAWPASWPHRRRHAQPQHMKAGGLTKGRGNFP